MTGNPNNELELTRALDSIQRNIWARINDEVQVRGVKLSMGDAYSLGSVIKEVLHPEVKKLLQSERKAVLQAIREKILKNTQDFEEVSADGDETWFEYLNPKTVLEILEGVE